MKIEFSNGKSFEYLSAYATEKDYKNGVTRQSMQVSLYLEQTSYNEIENIVNSNAINTFTLTGNESYSTDSDGNQTVIPAPVSVYENYTIPGKIAVEDGVITFKVYKLSDVEKQLEQATQAIDELLIAMEV